MRPFSRRDLAHVRAEARRNLLVRFRIHTKSAPTPATVTPDSLVPNQAADASRDATVNGKGVFEETRDSLQTSDAGVSRTRRGTIECSAKYEESFRSGYEVVIGGQRGAWTIKGVTDESSGTSIVVFVEARQ